MGSRRIAALVTALVLVALGLAHLAYHAGYTLDDAYISYRYARNCARGVGLVYNPGEYVKGYSNTLLTLLMTVPELLHSEPNAWSKALGFLAYVVLACSVCILYWQRATGVARDRALQVLALLAVSTPLAVHFTSGLETGLYTGLLFAAVVRRLYEQERDARPWSAFLFCLVVLSRPEGIALFGAMLVHDVLFRLHARRFDLRQLLFYGVPVACYLAELLFSLGYYGDIFPQTYYAKTEPLEGLAHGVKQLVSGALGQLRETSYFGKGLGQTRFGFWSLAALPLSLLAPDTRRQNSALLCVLLAQFVFIARAGEDWAPAFRFGVPLLPCLFLLMVEALGFIASFARRWQRPLAAALCAGLVAWTLPAQHAASLKIDTQRYVNAENKLRQGQFFATLAPPGITLSSCDIGGHGYGAWGFDILDTGGLTTRQATNWKEHVARANRYAALVAPELMRVHSSRRRDTFVTRTMRRQRPYLELDAGNYLLQRELVLVRTLPDAVEQAPPRAIATATLVAQSVPAALASGAEHQLVLYFRRGEQLPAALVGRTLEWVGTQGRVSAGASEVLWRHTPLAAWGPDEIFVDFVTVRAPGSVGRYELQLVQGDERIAIAGVDVLAGDALAVRARQLIAEAERAPSAMRLASLECAVALSPAQARAAYQRAVVVQAASLRAAAERESAVDPDAAMSTLRSANRLLHRALFLSGKATGRLRREIDRNGVVRKRLIDAALLGL